MILLLYNSVQKEQKANQIIVIGLCDQIPGDVSGSLRGSLHSGSTNTGSVFPLNLPLVNKGKCIPQRQKGREGIGGLGEETKVFFP